MMQGGIQSIPNILIVLLISMLYFMMFYVQRASEHSFRSQHCRLVMWGVSYLACPPLEVGRSLGDLRKGVGEKGFWSGPAVTSVLNYSAGARSPAEAGSIMGLFRVGRLYCLLISLRVVLFLPFSRCDLLVPKSNSYHGWINIKT